ncbi:hypothetical protein HanRHA438_Chr09g0410711 [Helianthus annuus]|nr:hypothetical protein HanRHA438_Chr09g0410711 [Helianthus annuus]
MTEFEGLKMQDTGTLDEFVSKLSGSNAATLEEQIMKLVKKFLTSTPRHFIHIVASLEQVWDLKTTGFENVVGRLKAYERESRKKNMQTTIRVS